MPFSFQPWIDAFKRYSSNILKYMKTYGPYTGICISIILSYLQDIQRGEYSHSLQKLVEDLHKIGLHQLADIINKLTDTSEVGIETIIAEAVKKAIQNEGMCNEFDTLIKELSTIQLAMNALSEADRQWFLETLKGELQRLGNFKKYEIVYNYNVIINNYYNNYIYITNQRGGYAPIYEKFEGILKKYLECVNGIYNKARLYGGGSLLIGQGRPERILTDVFVPISLRLTRSIDSEKFEQEIKGIEDETERKRRYHRHILSMREQGEKVPLEKLLSYGKQLVIVGGAGSGKSTVLSYFASNIANCILNGISLPFDMPKREKTLVPIVIPLRYHREYVNLCNKSPGQRIKSPGTGSLAAFIPWFLQERFKSNVFSYDFIDHLLLGGDCLLMFDGMDEIMDSNIRGMVRQEIENLVNGIYTDNWFIITTREAGYRENTMFTDRFKRFDVQRLDDTQTQTLVHNWCKQLYTDECESIRNAKELVAAIQHINNLRTKADLPPLISTPLMATMVISVKWGKNELPRDRARLYQDAVEVILQSQYLPEDEARRELIEWGIDRDELLHVLTVLAYEMHSDGEEGSLITEERLKEILRKELSEDKVNNFIEAVRLRGGLFEETAGLFQFVHLTFQEFLTACYLVNNRDYNIIKKHIKDSWWREVWLLIYGFAKIACFSFSKKYLEWLSDLAGDDMRLAGLELAGSALLEIEKPDSNLREAQAKKLSECLFNPQLRVSTYQRSIAGNTLALIGDPRPEVMTLKSMQFCYVPAGSFIMGSDRQEGKIAHEDEFPQHTLSLPAFYISRFPVTNAQFNAFVQEKGYENENYWTKKGWDWKNQQNITGPLEYDSPFNLLNHPVIKVSWYEALAFTRWLTDFWREQGVLSEGMAVQLPSEAEWEKAARGGMEILARFEIVSIADIKSMMNNHPSMKTNEIPKRIYPWGDKPDSNSANYDETGIGTTSAVGCFPTGASTYGCEEMSGNVWEWTRSLWGNEWDKPDFKYPYKPDDGRENLKISDNPLRVLRGGAFGNDSENVRCASRSGPYPSTHGYDNFGFRVVVSPFFSGL